MDVFFQNGLDLKDSGDFLDASEAICYLQKFLDHESSGFIGDVKETIISGQVFGLDNLRQFLQKIDQYNAGPSVDKIVAVRVYPSITNRFAERPSRYSNVLNKDLKDVILEPVLSDGTDLHRILDKAVAADKMLLGLASPCPTVCGKQFVC